MDDELGAAVNFFQEPGVVMLGQEMTDDEAMARVRERFPHKPFCLVRQWLWVDLTMPESVREELERSGRQPVVLYAHSVVLDSQGRFRSGDWVRSTPLVAFSEGCFFETSNSVYVLLGLGHRKTAPASTVVKIF